MYQELFQIKFNNKEFMLFLAKHKRVVFLQIIKGEYHYPNLDDFLALNKIYNERDPFICYSCVSFAEKVKKIDPKKNVAPIVLALTVILGTSKTAIASTFKPEVKDDEVVLTEQCFSPDNTVIDIKDIEDFDKILGQEEITIEKINAVIDQNPNLTEHEKEVAKKIPPAILEKYPNFNFRVYYENMKTIDVNTMTNSDFDLIYGKNIAGNYMRNINLINNREGGSDSVLSHEFMHASNSYYRKFGNKIVMFYDQYSFLNEAMTVELNNLVEIDNIYYLEKTVLDYFRTCVDFSVIDYNRYGTNILIDRLSQKYPEVDIHNLMDHLSNLHATNTYTQNNIKLDQTQVLDKLFLLALARIDINADNVYEPFADFWDLFCCVDNQNLIKDYYKKYNEAVIKKGYRTYIEQEKFETFVDQLKDVECVGFDKGRIFALTRYSYEENEKYEVLDNEGLKKLHHSAFKNYSPLKNVWLQNAIYNSGIVENYKIKTYDISYKGNKIANIYPYDVKIALGTTANNELGIILMDDKNNEIYKSEDNITNVSNFVWLNKILTADIANSETIELEKYLTPSNLAPKHEYDLPLFENIDYRGNQLVVEQVYRVNIPDYEYNDIIINPLTVRYTDQVIRIGDFFSISWNIPFNEEYRLVDILKEKALFNKENKINIESTDLKVIVMEYISKKIKKSNYIPEYTVTISDNDISRTIDMDFFNIDIFYNHLNIEPLGIFIEGINYDSTYHIDLKSILINQGLFYENKHNYQFTKEQLITIVQNYTSSIINNRSR